eukprot:g81653.t1
MPRGARGRGRGSRPPRGRGLSGPYTAANSQQDAPGPSWTCPRCTFANLGQGTVCQMCQSPRPSPALASGPIDASTLFEFSADGDQELHLEREDDAGRVRGRGRRGREEPRGDHGTNRAERRGGKLMLQGQRRTRAAEAGKNAELCGPRPNKNTMSRHVHVQKMPSSAPVKSGGRTKVLMVAEKPSIAQSIAQYISGGSFHPHARFGGTPVHEFNGTFQGDAAHFLVTSVTGHVYSTDFVPGYESWDKIDPFVLFDAPVRKTTEKQGDRICRHLQSAAKGVDFLVLWLDCDREGENICFEVIANTKPWMNRPARDIKKAMEHLSSPNENESLSVDARQELDLKMGVAFTRFQSRFFQNRYADLQSPLISFGPCQTPTLGFCVRRHDQIQTFSAEKYWVVVPSISLSGTVIKLEWERGRAFNRPVAAFFQSACSEQRSALVETLHVKSKKRARPAPLNTVEMLKVASRSLGMGPANTMHVAESLYIRGFISYPRTETTAYAPTFDLRGTIAKQCSNPHLGDHASMLLAQGWAKPKQGHDAGDHPPITPMRSASNTELGGAEWQLFDYITRHFLATVSGDAVFEITTATFVLAEERFIARAQKVVDPGFTAVMNWLGPDDDEEAVAAALEVKEGQRVEVAAVELVEKRTSPPGYLTEAELISLMEKHGIGTDASIAVHINAICERKFVSLGAGRTLIPTDLGIVLVHGYYKIDPDLVIPTTRGTVEKQLSLIAKGQAEHQAVVRHTLQVFQAKFKYFVESITKMDELFSAHFSTVETASGRSMGKCGKCGRVLKFIATGRNRLYCAICDETYGLPQDGRVKEYMGKVCPLDGFELVCFTTEGALGISFPLCPYCYNYPPFEDVAKVLPNMSCNRCPHPTCPQSLVINGAKKCTMYATCRGTLVFVPNSGPNWKLCCNSCNVVVKFADKAHKVSISKIKCEECQALTFSIDFHKDHSPLGGDETRRKGCIFCDGLLSKTTSNEFGHVRMKRGGGGKRGRGRGRGRKPMVGKDGKPTLEALLAHNG